MANKIYLVTKSSSEVIINGGYKKYSYVLGVELRDGTSGAVVPAKFLQTDECTAAFVGVMPYGGIVFSDMNTDTGVSGDELKITAHPLSEADSTHDVTVTIKAGQLAAIAVGAEVVAPQ